MLGSSDSGIEIQVLDQVQQLWLLRYNMSVAVAIGFIALAGVAAETGVIMLIYLDRSYRDRMRDGLVKTVADVEDAVQHGAVERVRPKIMTVTAIMAGLIPILWSQGTGADMMKRIAAPMLGGMSRSERYSRPDPVAE